MANIQKTLDSLQPYVIGIRYLEGTPLVDAVFKEGWTVPEEPNIKRIKGNEEMNYFMIFSETNGVGLDELLGYVERTIKLNQEREKKHELLKAKVNELKEIFKKNSLSKLTRLKFSFVEEELVPNLNDFDVDDDLISENNNEPIEEPIEEIDIIEEPKTGLSKEEIKIKKKELEQEDRRIKLEEDRSERINKLLQKFIDDKIDAETLERLLKLI